MITSLGNSISEYLDQISTEKFEKKNENSSSVLTEDTLNLDNTGNPGQFVNVSKGKYFQIRENLHIIPLT